MPYKLRPRQMSAKDPQTGQFKDFDVVSGNVVSVNNKTGAVSLDAGDIPVDDSVQNPESIADSLNSFNRALNDVNNDIFGEQIEQEPTVANLNLANNGTMYGANSDYRTHYIPVQIGDRVKFSLTCVMNNGYCRFGYSESTPANAVSATFLQQFQCNAGQICEYTYDSTINGYASVSYHKAFTNLDVVITKADGGSGICFARNNSEHQVFNAKIADIEDTTYDHSNILRDIKYSFGKNIYNDSDFEIGTIYIKDDNSGWEYQPSTKRARTKENVTIHLPAGVRISLTDYTDARIYIGWKKSNNTYGHQGWITSGEYVTVDEGDYVVVLSRKTETSDLSDVNDLLQYLVMYVPSDLFSLVPFVKTMNLHEPKSEMHGYYRADGTYNNTTNNDVQVSDYISANPSTTYVMQCWVPEGFSEVSLWAAIAEYTSEKVFIKRTDFTAASSLHKSLSVKLSDNTHYIRYMYHRQRMVYTMLSEGDIVPAYIPSSKELHELCKVRSNIGMNDPLLKPAKPRMIGHRGLESEAPENTIPSFELAGSGKAWGIETDIRETSDGYFVCMHDDTVDRMTDGTGSVASLTLSQIRGMTIDAGANIGQYPNLQVPTLEEYLKSCKRYGCVAIIDIKNVTHYKDMVDIIIENGLEGSVVFLARDENMIIYLREVTNMPIALDVQSNADGKTDIVKCYENVWIAPSKSILTEANIKYAHTNHVPVMSWTYSTKAEIVDAFEMGVDCAMTTALYDVYELS